MWFSKLYKDIPHYTLIWPNNPTSYDYNADSVEPLPMAGHEYSLVVLTVLSVVVIVSQAKGILALRWLVFG